MFTFYDVDVSDVSDKWEVTFLKDNKKTHVSNDIEKLKETLSEIPFLFGYGNYEYQDQILTAILRGEDINKCKKDLLSGKRKSRYIKDGIISLDLKQEIFNTELEEIKLNKGYPKTYDNLKLMKEVFEDRKDYFTSKFEIVDEFDLSSNELQRTIVNVAASVLNAKPSNDIKRLYLSADDRLKVNELPKPIIRFYKNIESRFKNKEAYQSLEKEKFNFKLNGIEHVYGFGGLHGAKDKYKGEGDYMHIDFKSFYPSLIINNKYLNEESLKKFIEIYEVRKKLQAKEESKEEAYKRIINIVYGGLKNKYNKLYNPEASNNVVFNGQLIMTHLIILLENFAELIQTNTDGIIIKYEQYMKKDILKLIKLFEQQYELEFDIKYIDKIAQRDVNNYVVRYTDKTIKGVGRFKNFEGGSYERNTLTIIDKALVGYFMHDIEINVTIINAWKNNDLLPFQTIVKSGNFDGIAHERKHKTLFPDEIESRYKEVDKVSRVFATRNKALGGVYRFKDTKERKYTKVAYTSENSVIWNGDINEMNKRNINLNWYIKEVEKWLF